MDPTTSGVRPPPTKRSTGTGASTTINALSHDTLSMIFAFLDLFELVRCSAVCKSWNTVVYKSKLLQIFYCKYRTRKSTSLVDINTCSESSLKLHLEELAMDRHRLSLLEGRVKIFQWKGHSVGIDQCRMKMGLVLTGVGDKVMRLWSVESYKCLDEYYLLDKAPLVDFDFDESKVVGLVGSRICIWRRNGKRNVFSSREGLFTKGLCMRYVDPEAVVGCEDGTARVFDMYSRKCSQIIKMNGGPVTCLSVSEDQLIVGGSSLGRIMISGLSSDQQIATLRSPDFAGIRTLCFSPCSHLLFAGSTAGHVICWDFRTMRTLWINRASPNVIYSMNHLRNDRSTLVAGGIDGVLRVLDQDSGEILSRCIMDEKNRVSNCSKDSFGIVEKKKARRLLEDTRIDLIPKIYRPPIRCLAVGMEKVVTTHNDKYIRVWKFNNS